MLKEQLLTLVEEGFQKPAWHGPNLKGALRGVGAQEALWRPAKDGHNIAEIVVHAAFWKHTVARRLTGSNKHNFPEKGRNWFIRDDDRLSDSASAKRWKNDLALLATSHAELCKAISRLKQAELTRPARGHRQSAMRNIAGIAMHDVYHSGQIQLLRKLYGSRTK